MIKIKALYNENTNSYEYDLLVKVVTKKDINFKLDTFIGSVEYTDGTYLDVYYNHEELIGYELSL